MIAIYSNDELGAALGLYDSEDAVEDGLADEIWTSYSSDLPMTDDLSDITDFLADRYWHVEDDWDYDQDSDQFVAAAYH
ncbi:hypothetical protein ACFWMR_02130 [Amycolatopsis thailandensis]|uniref:hypothetical protein n=1 Tax=Amycolatopsis thailandensis TaxID=589330 RepID=UPI00364FB890